MLSFIWSASFALRSIANTCASAIIFKSLALPAQNIQKETAPEYPRNHPEDDQTDAFDPGRVEPHARAAQAHARNDRVQHSRHTSGPICRNDPAIQSHRVYHGETTDWAMMNLAHDPLFQDPDGFPVPEKSLAQIQAIHRAGIEFCGLYIAHEGPVGSVEENKPIRRRAVTPPPSGAVTEKSAQLGKAGNALWTIALPFVEPRTAIDGAKKVADALATLDPVLLGVVIAPRSRFKEGQDAAWFYIGNWSFDDAT